MSSDPDTSAVAAVIGGAERGGADRDALGVRIVNVWKRGADLGAPASSNQTQIDEFQSAFSGAGAIEVPYDPQQLCRIFEFSNSLRQNVEAMAANIDGHGHSFEPVLKLDAADADARIANAMLLERLAELGDPSADDPRRQAALPSPEEVAARKAEIAEQMRIEESRLKIFFDFCSDEESFVELRCKTRQDLETTGSGYWEVLRDGAGRVSQFAYVPSWTVRLCPLDRKLCDVTARVRTSLLSFTDVPRRRRFRLFVQIVDGRLVYFKTFGDPRVVSCRNGHVYETLSELRKHEGENAVPATEIIHFRIHSPLSPYGVPRWVGNLMSVLGSREAEEVNLAYFNNKSVPPLAILVSGGRLTDSAVKRIEDHIESEIKGKGNFHKALILDAEPAAGASPESAGKMKIEIVPLNMAIHQDALFQNYDEKNADKVGMSFRLPRMLRGDIRDFNKSTAEAALLFAEQQVFNPLRIAFDFVMNRLILTALGIRYFVFVSRSPVTRDPATLTDMITKLTNANVLTTNDGRELSEEVFNRPFAKIDAPWAKQPVPLTVAGFAPVDPAPSPLSGPTLGTAAGAGADAGAAPPLESSGASALTDPTDAPAIPQDAVPAAADGAEPAAKALSDLAKVLVRAREEVAKAAGDRWFRLTEAS